MLDSDEAERTQNQDQEELSISNGPLHGEDECTDMDEFSELLTKVPTKLLWNELMTYQQRLSATALWQACNYGGNPKPGELRDVEDKRNYAEWVLRMDHRQQHAKAKKKR